MLRRSAVVLVFGLLLTAAPASAADDSPFQRRIHLGALGTLPPTGATFLFASPSIGPVVGPEVGLELLWPESHLVVIPNVHGLISPVPSVGFGGQIGTSFRFDGRRSAGNGATLDLQFLGGANLDLLGFYRFAMPTFTASMAAGLAIWSDRRELLCLRVEGGGLAGWSLPPVMARASVAFPWD